MPSNSVISFPSDRGLRPQLARLRSEVAGLRAESADLSEAFKAGRVSRDAFVARKRRIADDVHILTERMRALITPDAPQPPAPPTDMTAPEGGERDA